MNVKSWEALDSRILSVDDLYREYLHDESKLEGSAQTISFPQSQQELCEILALLWRQGWSVTVQGGRTGIVGGAVPNSSHILNLSRMNKVTSLRQDIEGIWLLDVQPGVTLTQLKLEIARMSGGKPPLFWPCDPTEPSATVGGVASCNAGGPSSHRYGRARDHIAAFTVVLPNAEILHLSGDDPLADAFLGGEGTCGVLTSLTLKLRPAPACKWGIAFFFSQDAEALRFGDALRTTQSQFSSLVAAEYMDQASIDLVQARKPMMAKLKELPDLPVDTQAMVYMEFHGPDEETVQADAEALMVLGSEYGVDLDAAWATAGDYEMERLIAFRHTVAEAVNIKIEQAHRICADITKQSTDMCTENMSLEKQVLSFRADMLKAGLSGCIFGHILGNHLHVNLMASTYDAYILGQSLLTNWAEQTIKNNGTIVTEHGIGKLKRSLYTKFADPTELAARRELKLRFDPQCRMNPNNIWKETSFANRCVHQTGTTPNAGGDGLF